LLFLQPRTLPAIAYRLLLVLLLQRLLHRWLAVCGTLAVCIRVALLPLRLLVFPRSIRLLLLVALWAVRLLMRLLLVPVRTVCLLLLLLEASITAWAVWLLLVTARALLLLLPAAARGLV
jgi:hypothetical protein